MDHYNRIAGQKVQRVEALSDGVFAIALTLLVLEIKVPSAKNVVVAQCLYLFGALCCFISTYLSIAIIISVQLNYAFAILSGRIPKKHLQLQNNFL
jgi:uncharacterized membrane protein